jgi:hypothetical protein
MSDILGYFVDRRGNPIAYMRSSGLILFSNKKELSNYNYLGDFNFLNRVISSGNRDIFSKRKVKKQCQHHVEQQDSLRKKGGGKSQLHVEQQDSLRKKGGGGFFGESQGTCGWGNYPSCCFAECAPLWRTTLWPFSNASM